MSGSSWGYMGSRYDDEELRLVFVYRHDLVERLAPVVVGTNVENSGGGATDDEKRALAEAHAEIRVIAEEMDGLIERIRDLRPLLKELDLVDSADSEEKRLYEAALQVRALRKRRER